MTKQEQVQALNQAVGILLSMSVLGTESKKHSMVVEAVQTVGRELSMEAAEALKTSSDATALTAEKVNKKT